MNERSALVQISALNLQVADRRDFGVTERSRPVIVSIELEPLQGKNRTTMTLTLAFLMAVGYGGQPPRITRFKRSEVAGLVVYVALLIVALLIAVFADVLNR